MVNIMRSVAAALGPMLISSPLFSQEQEFFHTSDQCIACHSGVVSPQGQDISIGYTWRASMMANSARDPYWQAGVRREVMDYPGARAAIEDTCATCHTLFTETLGDAGEEVGILAEQVPYHEWLHSDYRTTNTCQSCHMPELVEDAPITSVLGQLRPAVSQHVFRGGNTFMLGILNKYRGELGVTALPQELEASARSTREFLESETARVSVDSARMGGSTLELGVAVESLSGHKLPTAYPSRRAWLRVAVTDAAGNTLFESGASRPDGSIAGNDNDEDGNRFEPHYTAIDSADEVQIYESVMVDVRDEVTTGLLSGARYIKDNRLLPRGFDKSTASWEIAVNGAAADDEDFVAGGDRVQYLVDVSGANGAITVSVDLLFQSIGYRWAENLRDYDAMETNRFVGYYEESASSSTVTLASDSFTLP